VNLLVLQDNGSNDLKGLNFRISNDIFTRDNVTLENMQCCQLQAARAHLGGTKCTTRWIIIIHPEILTTWFG